MKNLLLFFILIATLATGFALAQGSSIHPATLRCEYRVNPTGIDEREPRLSWLVLPVKPGARGLRQTAYRIEAASSEAALLAGKADVWDSGKVDSGETAQIVYAGKPLASREKVFWRVQVWGQDGQASAWSDPARWSMGLLDAGDWKGKWIGADESPDYENPESVFQHLKTAHWISSSSAVAGKPLYFRAAFTPPAGRKIRRAIVLMGADARYEFLRAIQLSSDDTGHAAISGRRAEWSAIREYGLHSQSERGC